MGRRTVVMSTTALISTSRRTHRREDYNEAEGEGRWGRGSSRNDDDSCSQHQKRRWRQRQRRRCRCPLFLRLVLVLLVVRNIPSSSGAVAAGRNEELVVARRPSDPRVEKLKVDEDFGIGSSGDARDRRGRSREERFRGLGLTTVVKGRTRIVPPPPNARAKEEGDGNSGQPDDTNVNDGDDGGGMVHEEQLVAPSQAPSTTKKATTVTTTKSPALPTAASPMTTPPPKDTTGPGGEDGDDNPPTTIPTTVPAPSPIPVVPTAAPTAIRMDVLVLELGLVKTSQRKRRQQRRRTTTAARQHHQQQQQHRRTGSWFLQSEAVQDDSVNSTQVVVLEALEDFLCYDTTIVAVRNSCPDASRPLQVAASITTSNSTSAPISHHEPVVTVVTVLSLLETTIRASHWTIRYPIVVTYDNDPVLDGSQGTFYQNKVQLLLNQKMRANKSRFYQRVYVMTGGYVPVVVSPNVTNWVDAYYNNSSHNNGSNSTVPSSSPPTDNSTTSDTSLYDPDRLGALRLVGVFVLVLTVDAYAVLLYLARRRRAHKRLETTNGDVCEENGDSNGPNPTRADPEALRLLVGPVDGHGGDSSLISQPASPPAGLSATFEGMSTSSSSASDVANPDNGPTATAPTADEPPSVVASRSDEEETTEPTTRRLLWFT